MSFRQSSNIDQHFRIPMWVMLAIHASSNPYRCKECGDSFSPCHSLLISENSWGVRVELPLGINFIDLMSKKNCSNEKPLNFAVSFVTAPWYGLPWWIRWWSACLQCGKPRFDLWIGKIPWRSKWQPTPILLPGKYHGWRSLVGYSPWGSQRVGHDWETSFSLSLCHSSTLLTSREF